MALYVYVYTPYVLGLFALVSLLGIYFFVRRPLKSWSRWGAVWIFCTSGKYKFCRHQAKRAETANYFSANQN